MTTLNSIFVYWQRIEGVYPVEKTEKINEDSEEEEVLLDGIPKKGVFVDNVLMRKHKQIKNSKGCNT